MSTDLLERDEQEETTSPAPVRPPGLPLWFEAGLLFAVVALICVGGLGVALAYENHYSFGLAAGIGVPVAVALSVAGGLALRGRAPRRPDRSRTTAPTLAALVLVGAVTFWNQHFAGTWILIDRDPGIYAVAAKWLTRHTGLTSPWAADWVGTGLPLTGNSFGVDDVDGAIQTHFNHLTAMVFAQAGAIGGDRALLRASAVLLGLGLLALYAAGVRLTGRPWLTLAAVATVALALPTVNVARGPWSEPLTLFLVWGAVWLLTVAWDRSPAVLGALAGLALGGVVMARIDALVYLLPLLVLAGVAALLLGRDERWRRVAVLAGCAAVFAIVPVVVGTVEVMNVSGSYFRVLRNQIVPLQKATAAAAVIGFVGILLARPLRRVTVAVRNGIGMRLDLVTTVVGVATTIVFTLVWALRPALQEVRGGGIHLIETLQKREGVVPLDDGRLYYEHSLDWMVWYLGGATVALAAVGLGVMVRRGLRGASAAVIVLGTVGFASAYYLYKPSVTPDHLFGMRRFVPAIFPLLALAAVVALAAGSDLLQRALGPTRRGLVRVGSAVAALGLALSPVATTGPLRDLQPHQGLLAAVTSVCDGIGPDAAIVFPYPSYGQTTGQQTFRSWCDVPVAGSTRMVTAAELRQAARVMASRGRTLWVVDSGSTYIGNLFGAASVVTFAGAQYTRDPTMTLTHPPQTYTPFTITFFGVPVPTS
ncbi:hypothetical protein ACXR2U_02150 [Jatrophihabitans sp. YIM 134969]